VCRQVDHLDENADVDACISFAGRLEHHRLAESTTQREHINEITCGRRKIESIG
jgi:hypothetical protein